jgi:methylthioribulose-1-phosphate dehydratase
MTAASFADAKRAIVAAGRRLDGKGWAPATAGNYSMRPDDGDFAITVSGRATRVRGLPRSNLPATACRIW